LIGIQQALTLAFEALPALEQLGLLGSQCGHIVLFALGPALVELRQERGRL